MTLTIGKETLLLNNNRVSNLKNFEKNLPASLIAINELLGKHGYVVTIVGGIVRDYFLEGKIGKDWDMEVTHASLAWELKNWKDLGKELGQIGRVTFLPYDVLRVEAHNMEFELSPPRKETFTDEDHHKNFSVSFDFRTPFEESVKRRDFTINAMGVRLTVNGKSEMMDPLNGLLHLREKMLHPCSEDFAKDPVRFLRALRFSTKLGFSFSEELKKDLAGMKLSGISAAYFWTEMQKSGNPLLFYRKCLEEKEIHPEFSLPVEDMKAKIPNLEKVLAMPSKHESWIIALEWEEIDSSSWQKFFNLSSETGKRLQRWAKVTKAFTKKMPEDFHGEFETLRDTADFESLFDWYFTTKQILQKNPELPLLQMIETFLPHWIYLYKFEAPKDVKHIDPPYRAKYQVWNLCQRS